MGNIVNIRSEIAPLKKVLLHRPGGELLNLVPDYLAEMLFDDIPWLTVAQREHDDFARTLEKLGAEVVYLKDLVCGAIKNDEIKGMLADDFLKEAVTHSPSETQKIREFLLSLPTDKMVDVMIAGLRKTEFQSGVKKHLADFLSEQYPFLLDPMPNMYFQRDPFSFAGGGVIIGKMFTKQRSRENLFAKYIFSYHDDFSCIPVYYNRNYPYNIEGGDILVLNEYTLAVGISQRTHADAIEELSKNILGEESGFTQIVAIDIPKQRTFMHLDTVFTMIDHDTFSIHPNTQSSFVTFVVTKKDGKIKIERRDGGLDEILSRVLGIDKVRLIKCGGESMIDAAREQWNDGANTLAVAPGEVVVYGRNTVTNRLFEENGIKIHEIACSELSRGRGGPRCMSMPVVRSGL